MTSDSEEGRISTGTEAWLRGPLPGVSLLLTPAAHALTQAAIDIKHAVAPLTAKEVWNAPSGAPSVGFHVRHIAGSLDRLLTYARGRQLSTEQLRELAVESLPGEPAEEAVMLVLVVLQE